MAANRDISNLDDKIAEMKKKQAKLAAVYDRDRRNTRNAVAGQFAEVFAALADAFAEIRLLREEIDEIKRS